MEGNKITVKVETEGLNEALKKANQLKKTLQESQDIINSLSGNTIKYDVQDIALMIEEGIKCSQHLTARASLIPFTKAEDDYDR